MSDDICFESFAGCSLVKRLSDMAVGIFHLKRQAKKPDVVSSRCLFWVPTSNHGKDLTCLVDDQNSF